MKKDEKKGKNKKEKREIENEWFQSRKETTQKHASIDWTKLREKQRFLKGGSPIVCDHYPLS